MTPAEFLRTVIEPATLLLPPQVDSPKARCLLLAIAGQESGWERQRPRETIEIRRGYWGCTKNHAVLWVLHNSLTRPVIRRVCAELEQVPGLDEVFSSIEMDDRLAYCVARLFLIAAAPDERVPEIGDDRRAWLLYERVWLAAPPSSNVAHWHAVYSAAAACFDLPEAA